MSNPFTNFLRQWNRRPDLDEFVRYWDALERIVVRVYREKATVEEAGPEFEQVWPWLRRHYGEWREVLRPFWQQTKAAGAPTQTDPFQMFLNMQSPQDIVGDWRAMQHLPAAREAVNQYLLAKSDSE